MAEHTLKAGAVFKHRGGTYRLDAFLCEVETRPSGTAFLDQLIAEINAEEDAKVPQGHRRIKLRFCLPHEATYVAGSGVCGCVAAITDIEIDGTVAWSAAELAEHHEEALVLGREGAQVETVVRPCTVEKGD